MRVFVTGGSGRIGKLLISELDKAGYEVSVFDLVEPESKKYKFIKGDLREFEKVKEASKNSDAIIHLGAIPFDLPKEYKKLWDINATGTFHILEAAAQNQIKKVIFASSICTLGIGFWKRTPIEILYFPVDEKHPCKPHDLYGLSKLIGEQLCYMYTKRFGITTICLRLASVCFTAPEGGPTKEWLEEFERDIKPCILNPKSCVDKPEKDWAWEYVAAEDVVQAFLLALKKEGVEHEVYNIGAADTPTELDSLELARLYYPKAKILYEKEFHLNRKKALFDISKAQKELGYQPKVNWSIMSSRLFPKK
jgi:nucleoside-diphosphate-sugar epimerase